MEQFEDCSARVKRDKEFEQIVGDLNNLNNKNIKEKV